jgi:deoxyribonuclease-1-like protein
VRRFIALLIIGLLVAGIGYTVVNYQFEQLADGWRITRRTPVSNDPWIGESPIPVRTGETIKVATFNIQVFGRTKSSKPHVMDLLSRVVREFDVVAIQEIRSRDDDIIPNFVDKINESGRHYDFIVGQREGRTKSKEQYAYIFDRETIEVDRSSVYSVQDPSKLLHRPPLVSLFRVRGPEQDQAFTFSLVNVHIDPDEVGHEMGYMDDIFRRVRSDGREEDDVILLGDFNAGDQQLASLATKAGMNWVLRDHPTNVKRTQQYDNIVFHQMSTTEFSGRGGIFDFVRKYNLTTEQAEEVSDHFPVWAEFSVYEGGQPGRVATRPATSPVESDSVETIGR